MMGTSSRFDHAPDFYFCTAFWLLGNYTLGHWDSQWEGQAWYSTRWPTGQLPVVAALKAEPKQPRPWRGDAGSAGRVAGTVQAGAGLTVQLLQTASVSGPGLGWSLTVRVGADGRYEVNDVPLGSYRVLVVEAAREETVTLTRERPTATANFDLTGVVVNLANSVVAGKVRGGAGMSVGLARSATDGTSPTGDWAQQQTVAADGSYRFAGLHEGAYVLALIGTNVARAGIVLDGRNEVAVDLDAPGWGWEAQDGGASPGFGVVRCQVKDRPETIVRLWAAGWQGMIQRTGTKLEYGPDVCEFAPLGAGVYLIQPEGIEAVAQITVDGSRVSWVRFTKTAGEAVHNSIIEGRVRNGAGRTIVLTGPDSEKRVTITADGAYRFEGLAAGIYRVAVVESDVARDGIVLDGLNQVTVDLALPVPSAPAASSIFGTVTNGAGRIVRLFRPAETASLAEVTAGSDGTYRFADLTASIYTLRVADVTPDAPPAAERGDIALDGRNSVQVDFTLPAPTPAAAWVIEDGGPGPGFSVVRCRVSGRSDREVRLWTSGWSGVTQRIGSKPEYGSDACEFAPLGAGTYYLQAADIEPRAELRVEPNRVVWARLHTVSLPVVPPPAPVEPGPSPAPQPTLPVESVPVPQPPESPPADIYGELPRSVVKGRVKAGAGRTIVLEGPDGLKMTTTAADDEAYSFTDLPAGVYRATIPDTDPPTGSTQTQAGIELDGTDTVTIDFDLDAFGPGKTQDHYLLVGSPARSKDDFLAVLRYVGRFQPIIGSDDAEARQARHVTILGGMTTISAVVEQGLKLSGCQVQRIESDYAARLGRLLQEGRPY
jgi:hypothetical protein